MFLCVCTCTNLLVLNTEVKISYVHEPSSNGASKPVLVSVLSVAISYSDPLHGKLHHATKFQVVM